MLPELILAVLSALVTAIGCLLGIAGIALSVRRPAGATCAADYLARLIIKTLIWILLLRILLVALSACPRAPGSLRPWLENLGNIVSCANRSRSYHRREGPRPQAPGRSRPQAGIIASLSPDLVSGEETPGSYPTANKTTWSSGTASIDRRLAETTSVRAAEIALNLARGMMLPRQSAAECNAHRSA
jgi:hypothetical protein